MMVQLVKQLDDSVRIEVIEVRIGQKWITSYKTVSSKISVLYQSCLNMFKKDYHFILICMFLFMFIMVPNF